MLESSQLPELLEILTLQKINEKEFCGKNLLIGSPNIYGGQVLAQAISAANTTIQDDKILHSVHSYFINPGDNDLEIHFRVEIVKDGKSFNTRRVVASQKGRDIFILSASYHKLESGIEHQDIMPNVARPESLTSFSDLFAEFALKLKIQPKGIFASNGPFVFYPVESYDPFHPRIRPALNHTWFKANGILPSDPLIHQTTLAYASDFNLLITALFPHGMSYFTKPMQIASLDHAMWFHRPVKTDDWLLYAVSSTNANNGRALCSGKIYTRDGVLVASTAQEGLIRLL